MRTASLMKSKPHYPASEPSESCFWGLVASNKKRRCGGAMANSSWTVPEASDHGLGVPCGSQHLGPEPRLGFELRV